MKSAAKGLGLGACVARAPPWVAIRGDPLQMLHLSHSKCYVESSRSKCYVKSSGFKCYVCALSSHILSMIDADC